MSKDQMSRDMKLSIGIVSLAMVKQSQSFAWILYGGTVFAATLAALVSMAASRSDNCPKRCDCRSPEVYCARASLTAFPAGLDNATTFLDVGHNNITIIHDDVFVTLNLSNLVSLVADNNSIETVEPNAFRGLSRLEFLHLSGNKIQTLSVDLLKHNLGIRHIDLTGNALILPPEGSFLNAAPLEWLDLDFCNLSSIPPDAFKGTPKLRFLNLNNNDLSSVPEEMVRKLGYLRYLKLQTNPLECDCMLKKVWTWASHQKTKVEATCESPELHHGKPWSILQHQKCNTTSQ